MCRHQNHRNGFCGLSCKTTHYSGVLTQAECVSVFRFTRIEKIGVNFGRGADTERIVSDCTAFSLGSAPSFVVANNFTFRVFGDDRTLAGCAVIGGNESELIEETRIVSDGLDQTFF